MFSIRWRAIGFSGRQRVVTVIGRGLHALSHEPRPSELYGYIIEQPRIATLRLGCSCRGHVLAYDSRPPRSSSILDHYIHPTRRFLRSWSALRTLPERVVDRLVWRQRWPIDLKSSTAG